MATTYFSRVRRIKSECWRKRLQLAYLSKCTYYWSQIEKSFKFNFSQFKWPEHPIYNKRPYHYLHYWYNYGFKKGYLTIDFKYFESIVRGQTDQKTIYQKPYEYRRTWRWSKGWIKQHYGKYRQGTSYRRNPEHKKKVQENKEINDKLWKHSKRGKNKRRWPRKPQKMFKRMRSRQHRRWAKKEVYRHNWDKFHNKEREAFVDSFIWD